MIPAESSSGGSSKKKNNTASTTQYANAFPSTVSELSGHKYQELRFSASSETPIEGDYIPKLCTLISQCGVDVPNTNVYDENVEAAVQEFQKMTGMTQNGILTNSVLQSMIYYSYRLQDSVDDETQLEDGTDTSKSKSPHYNSFFDIDKLKQHRLNHKDIKIVLGNDSIVKTIKDVFMRSVSVEVDTSGDPISEVYEFIARDIQESDEISDINKYNGEEPATSSDIKYIYNFNTMTSDKTGTSGKF